MKVHNRLTGAFRIDDEGTRKAVNAKEFHRCANAFLERKKNSRNCTDLPNPWRR